MDESSTTIESIPIEKYYREEVSRVGSIIYSPSGGHCIYGNSIYSEDIVYSVINDVKKSEDVLNVLILINKAFIERAEIVYNPRNAMYISRIDGKLNSDMIVQRDTLINANTFLYLGRNNYTKKQMSRIKEIKARQKEYYKTTI